MSGIAEVLVNLGYHISGSDVQPSETTARLQKLGARVVIGHAAENIGNADVVVTSTAVKADNPEVSRGAPEKYSGNSARGNAGGTSQNEIFCRRLRQPRQNHDHVNDFHHPCAGRFRSDHGHRRETGKHRQQCAIRRR
ncbi:MAG: Mur ligase domain-containing protein [Desulfosudis oleivorans]|nr:Mur ligase domain-containing protein [Desulfosudis oleivorans]